MELDRIYLLKFVSKTNEGKTCVTENYLRRIGVGYSIWYTSDFPLSDDIVTAMGCTVKSEVDCTMNHYTIIRQAYERGFKHIAVIEEDVLFNGVTTKEEFEKLLDEIPSDSDITRLCQSLPYNKKAKDKFVKGCKLWGTQFYILNRKGMEYYINEIEKKFTPADFPLVNEDANVNIYSLTDNTFEHLLNHSESITESINKKRKAR